MLHQPARTFSHLTDTEVTVENSFKFNSNNNNVLYNLIHKLQVLFYAYENLQILTFS